jgi:hypothetical protein
MRRVLGEEMAERIGPVSGEDQDGELANMFKRTPQQGVWFIAGSLTQARVYSKYMALQIKAIEEGLIDTEFFRLIETRIYPQGILTKSCRPAPQSTS